MGEMYKSKVRTTRRSLYADVIPTEDEEQEALFRWAEAQSATKPWLKGMFAIPNGGYRAKATAARMKRTGTRAGVPDIFLPVSNGREHGLFIEMKRRKGGTVSSSQKVRMKMLTAEGYRCVVAKGCQEAIDAIMRYMDGE